jgi:hypothetical protein
MATDVWRLLGFDAREHPEYPFTPPIPADVREEFLLRPDVGDPFSVDSHMWPTVFHYSGHLDKLLGPPNRDLLSADPDCDGRLWMSLSRMLARLSQAGRKAVIISVELLAPEGITVNEFPSPLIYSRTDPAGIPVGSELLGYDAANVGFMSGLSNCGYTEEERGILRPQWEGKINEHGLIKTEEDALTFREIADKRDPEEAPFWVFRLHRLPDL